MPTESPITGKDLIALGYTPGRWFAPALAHANDAGLRGAKLRAYLESARPRTLAAHAPGSLPLHVNLHAENPEEQANVTAVRETMETLLRTPTLTAGAVMPDACPAGGPGTIPVGGVAVARDALHPGLHSADVCCSVMATSLGAVDPRRVLDAAQSVTHFGGGGREDPFALPAGLEERLRANQFLNNDKSRTLARTHLGTQGDGNHFLFVGQSERTGETFVVTHHGSRGLGAYLYTQGMRVAETFRQERGAEVLPANAWIPYSEPLGRSYWEALQVVRDWTKANHTVLHDAIARGLRREVTDRFWNEHNFVFREGDLFYHAKGATPLTAQFVPDSACGRRLVPLNMAEPILVVRGERTATNLGFAPHGAGRNRSRTAHLRRMGGRPAAEVLASETAGLDVRFFSGHVDLSELPSAYKDAAAVQRQMEGYGLGTVVDRILPYGCIMAGDWKRDAPWRKRRRRKD